MKRYFTYENARVINPDVIIYKNPTSHPNQYIVLEDNEVAESWWQKLMPWHDEPNRKG